jgi:hypothetical protein
MAQPDFTSPPTLRVTAPKPKMTVYYGLLIIALICMLMACLFLYLEIRRFGGFGTVPQRISAIEQTDLLISADGFDCQIQRMQNAKCSMQNAKC